MFKDLASLILMATCFVLPGLAAKTSPKPAVQTPPVPRPPATSATHDRAFPLGDLVDQATLDFIR